MMALQPNCEQRVDGMLAGVVDDIDDLWRAYRDGTDPNGIREYGLSFDYVAPESFPEQHEGYWRWQLSWGGPSDEVRFFASSPQDPCYRIEYAFMDWFDGARRVLQPGTPAGDLMRDLWAWYQETGVTKSEYDKARED